MLSFLSKDLATALREVLRDESGFQDIDSFVSLMLALIENSRLGSHT